MKILKADFNGSSFHRVYFIGISFSFSYADRIIIRFSSQDNFPPLGPNSFVTSGFVLSIEELLISHVVHYMSILSRLQRRIFPRESSRLSKSGIEIWKFLTSYIRALLAPSLSLFSFSASSPGASILIGLPLAFPYPHTSTHTNNTYTSPPLCARRYSSHPYHIFLHIMPLFSEPHLFRERS